MLQIGISLFANKSKCEGIVIKYHRGLKETKFAGLSVNHEAVSFLVLCLPILIYIYADPCKVTIIARNNAF